MTRHWPTLAEHREGEWALFVFVNDQPTSPDLLSSLVINTKMWPCQFTPYGQEENAGEEISQFNQRAN